jgi:hypothetical protein
MASTLGSKWPITRGAQVGKELMRIIAAALAVLCEAPFLPIAIALAAQ